MKKLNILETECDCEICSLMCEYPCCGTPQDMQNLIDNGFSSRLMLDQWPDGEIMLKPALKGFESEEAPWQPGSKEGCTFWINGKCELHEKNLKPIQGKLVNHTSTHEEHCEISEFIDESWSSKEGIQVINCWKKMEWNWINLVEVQ